MLKILAFTLACTFIVPEVFIHFFCNFCLRAIILLKKWFVICLLFLFTVVWSWNTMVNYFGPENLVAEKMTGSDDKVVQKLDEVISALMEANHFTNLSVQPTLSFTSNIARRYRPGGFTFDKFMEYQLEEREMLLKNHLKTTFFFSQEYAARQKYAGYYIFSLRKIII